MKLTFYFRFKFWFLTFDVTLDWNMIFNLMWDLRCDVMWDLRSYFKNRIHFLHWYWWFTCIAHHYHTFFIFKIEIDSWSMRINLQTAYQNVETKFTYIYIKTIETKSNPLFTLILIVHLYSSSVSHIFLIFKIEIDSWSMRINLQTACQKVETKFTYIYIKTIETTFYEDFLIV